MPTHAENSDYPRHPVSGEEWILVSILQGKGNTEYAEPDVTARVEQCTMSGVRRREKSVLDPRRAPQGRRAARIYRRAHQHMPEGATEQRSQEHGKENVGLSVQTSAHPRTGQGLKWRPELALLSRLLRLRLRQQIAHGRCSTHGSDPDPNLGLHPSVLRSGGWLHRR